MLHILHASKCILFVCSLLLLAAHTSIEQNGSLLCMGSNPLATAAATTAGQTSKLSPSSVESDCIATAASIRWRGRGPVHVLLLMFPFALTTDGQTLANVAAHKPDGANRNGHKKSATKRGILGLTRPFSPEPLFYWNSLSSLAAIVPICFGFVSMGAPTADRQTSRPRIRGKMAFGLPVASASRHRRAKRRQETAVPASKSVGSFVSQKVSGNYEGTCEWRLWHRGDCFWALWLSGKVENDLAERVGTPGHGVVENVIFFQSTAMLAVGNGRSSDGGSKGAVRQVCTRWHRGAKGGGSWCSDDICTHSSTSSKSYCSRRDSGLFVVLLAPKGTTEVFYAGWGFETRCPPAEGQPGSIPTTPDFANSESVT